MFRFLVRLWWHTFFEKLLKSLNFGWKLNKWFSWYWYCECWSAHRSSFWYTNFWNENIAEASSKRCEGIWGCGNNTRKESVCNSSWTQKYGNINFIKFKTRRVGSALYRTGDGFTVNLNRMKILWIVNLIILNMKIWKISYKQYWRC